MKCDKCGDERLFKKPDPCLGGYLPGVAHACCGHGNKDKAYCCGWDNCKPDESVGSIEEIVTDGYGNLMTIDVISKPKYWEKRGQEAIDYMNSLKENHVD